MKIAVTSNIGVIRQLRNKTGKSAIPPGIPMIARCRLTVKLITVLILSTKTLS